MKEYESDFAGALNFIARAGLPLHSEIYNYRQKILNKLEQSNEHAFLKILTSLDPTFYNPLDN